MKYHSHVLNIPRSKPFDNEHRWTTFLGEFVKPIVEGRDFLFWFSYYGDYARFRIYTENYDPISLEIEALIGKLGLTYVLGPDGSRAEAAYTLEMDLGCDRFLGTERSDVSATERGLAVLKLVHAGSQLFLSTLVREGEYWREEICRNPNNPYESSSRSYIHLLHNLCASDAEVVAFNQPGGKGEILSEYYFSRIQPAPPHRRFRVRL